MKECVNQEKYNSDDFVCGKKTEKKEKMEMRNLCRVIFLVSISTFVLESYFNIDILS